MKPLSSSTYKQLGAICLLLLFTMQQFACGAATNLSPQPRGGGTEQVVPGSQEAKVGQSEFETEELRNENPSFQTRNKTGELPPAPLPPKEDGAKKGQKKGYSNLKVEEADLYKKRENTLFLLNTYRGLQIFDISNPQKPKKLSTVKLYGFPVEMYLQKNIAYLLLRDVMYLSKEHNTFAFQRHHVSQLIVLDIQSLRKPKVLQRINIQGKITEGNSRIIGKSLFIISHTKQNDAKGWSYQKLQSQAQLSIYAFDISNPTQIRLKKRFEALRLPKNTKHDKNERSAPPNDSLEKEHHAEMMRDSGSAPEKRTLFDAGTGTPSQPDRDPEPTGDASAPPETRTKQDTKSTGKDPKDPDPIPSQKNQKIYLGIVVTTTSNGLIVAERWRHFAEINDPEHSCTSYRKKGFFQTTVNIISLTDKGDGISLSNRFSFRGNLKDSSKQAFIQTGKSQTPNLYVALLQKNQYTARKCGKTIQNLRVFDLSSPEEIKAISSLSFGQNDELLGASTFDLNKRYVYVVTEQKNSTLHILSFQDPHNPIVLGKTNDLPKDISLLRFIEQKKFLLAVGLDQAEQCTNVKGQRSSKVAVTILDIKIPKQVKQLQRECIIIPKLPNANATLDIDPNLAHKMIGLYSEQDSNILSLPFTFTTKQQKQGWTQSITQSAVALLQWDLRSYQASPNRPKSPLLKGLATIIHPKGKVKRSILFSQTSNSKKSRLMLTISESVMSFTDISQLDKPKRLSTVELAPYVRSVYRFGSYMVEQVSFKRENAKYNEFRIKKVSEGKLSSAAIINSFQTGAIQSTLRWGKYLILAKAFSQEKESAKTELLFYDFSIPTAPKLQSKLSLPYKIPFSYEFYCNEFDSPFKFQTPKGSRWAKTDKGLVSLAFDSKNKQSIFISIDLRQPKNPTARSYPLPKNIEHLYLRKLDGKKLYLVSRQEVGEQQRDKLLFVRYKYFVQLLTLQGKVWNFGDPINLPGRLLKMYRNQQRRMVFLSYNFGHLVETYNNGIDPTKSRSRKLHRIYLLEQIPGKAKAVVKDFKSFPSWQWHDVLLDDQWLYLNLSPAQSIHKKVQPSPQGHHLFVFDLSADRFEQSLKQNTKISSLQLMGVYKQRLFLNLKDEGILIADLRDPKSPKALHFERTLGWSTHIEFDKDQAFAAAGHFGLYQLDLTKITLK